MRNKTQLNRILQLSRSKLGTACGNTASMFITTQS